MKYYIDHSFGSSDYFHLFNLTTGEHKELQKTKENIDSLSSLLGKIYCFDLYRLKRGLGSFPFVYDLQSLYGLTLKKVNGLDELLDKETNQGYFNVVNKINAHFKSYENAKISIADFSLKKLVPLSLYEEYYVEKIKALTSLVNKDIDESIVEYYEKPEIFQAIQCLLAMYDNKSLHMPEYKHEIAFKYNFFGSKNSRLTIRSHGVNFYNLPKEERSQFTSKKNHILVQFDYKSFQPRLALSMFADEQMKEKLRTVDDIYSIFPGDREDNKIELISWMFSNRKNPKFDTLLSSVKKHRYSLWQLASKRKCILNTFGRPIFFEKEEENVVFQNYICSVESDSIFHILTQVFEHLKNAKSSIITPFYDCLLCSIHRDEFDQINQIKDIMEKYLYRHFSMHFPVTVKVGNNLANLVNFESVDLLESYLQPNTNGAMIVPQNKGE